jgi:hypothetical protein
MPIVGIPTTKSKSAEGRFVGFIVERHKVHCRKMAGDWLRRLQALRQQIQPQILAAKMPTLDAQNLQNCCCEWERVRLGEGKPRSRYPGLP